MKSRKSLLIAAVLLLTSMLLASCAGGGTSRVTYGMGVGYGGYYGPGPWGRYPGGPVYIGGGGGPSMPDIPDGPIATPMPEFGMPDMGSMDMGGFDF